MSQNSFQEMVEINLDSYVKNWVVDLRQAVCQVDYQPSGKSIFYLIKYIDTGYFVVVLRTIPDVQGNHLASWIFVPYSLRIADKDLYDVVMFVTKKVANSEVTGKDINDMRELFAHDYDDDLQAPVFAPSEGLSYAYRYYGAGTGATLQDLLGMYKFQTCYLQFAGVLLVDTGLTSDVAGSNLTTAPLDPMAVLLPPMRVDENGYRPTIYNQPFDVAYYVPMSRNIDIVWRKPDNPDIKQVVSVTQSEMRAPGLTPPRPVVPQQPVAPKPAPQPTVKTEDVRPTETADVPKRKKTYHFQIPAKSAAIGTVIEFEITTNSELDDSPIDGYEVTGDIQEGAGRSNHLLYHADNPRRNYINYAIAAGCGFVAGILLMLIIGWGKGSSKDKEVAPAQPAAVETQAPAQAQVPAQAVEQPVQAQPAQPAAPATAAAQPAAAQDNDVSLQAAVRYLDTHKVWDKAEMEQYPDLVGLYEDMNNIDRHKLVEYWGPKLQESRAFTNQIVHHSKLSYRKTAKNLKGGTKYNAPGDTRIQVQGYLNCIDP